MIKSYLLKRHIKQNTPKTKGGAESKILSDLINVNQIAVHNEYLASILTSFLDLYALHVILYSIIVPYAAKSNK